MSDDLVARLTCALDEDERIAEAASHACSHVDYCDDEARVFDQRHTPERVLRMVAAHRRILDLHADFDGRCAHCVQWCDDCTNQAECDHGTENRPFPCPTVQALAEAYGVTMGEAP